MHRVDTSGNVGNRFDDGDPDVPREATVVDKHILNAFQEEICHVVETAGITLVKDTNTQLYAAILKIIGSPPTITYPSLANGANVSGERKLCHWTDANGAVHIEGYWDAGAGLDVTGKLAWAAATLASGLRPTSNITQTCFATSAGGVQGLALIDIKTDGSLKVYRTNAAEGIDSIADPRYVRIQAVYHPSVAAAA